MTNAVTFDQQILLACVVLPVLIAGAVVLGWAIAEIALARVSLGRCRGRCWMVAGGHGRVSSASRMAVVAGRRLASSNLADPALDAFLFRLARVTAASSVGVDRCGNVGLRNGTGCHAERRRVE